MMKKSQDIEDPRKKSRAAAENFESTHSVPPPAFVSKSKINMTAASNAQVTEQEPENTSILEQDQEQDSSGFATISPNKLFNAVATGHNLFKQASMLNGVTINGARAIGPPGCLSAPNVSSIIQADLEAEMDTIENFEMAKAVSKVLGRFLNEWKNGFRIPGLSWYPVYQYFPGPVAPPMPNIPTPLSAIPSLFEFYLTHKENMISEILRELPSEMDNEVNRETLETFGDRTVNYFENWISSSYMVGLMGMGSIPGFSPPMSFGGPVHGQVLPKAGVLN